MILLRLLLRAGPNVSMQIPVGLERFPPDQIQPVCHPWVFLTDRLRTARWALEGIHMIVGHGLVFDIQGIALLR